MADAADTIIKMITSRKSYNGNAILQPSEPLDRLGLDSMEVVSLTFDIEEKFNIELPFNANLDIKSKTVADLIETVNQLVAARAKTA
jgi:acyl carrier protein